MAPAAAIRTLIVEDHPAIRRGLKLFVEGLGHNVSVAGTVAEAMDRLSGCDQVVLDLNLPDGTGADVLRHIGAERLPLRVAIVTGAEGALLEEARALRPDALFQKPADLCALQTWLRAA